MAEKAAEMIAETIAEMRTLGVEKVTIVGIER